MCAEVYDPYTDNRTSIRLRSLSRRMDLIAYDFLLQASVEPGGSPLSLSCRRGSGRSKLTHSETSLHYLRQIMSANLFKNENLLDILARLFGDARVVIQRGQFRSHRTTGVGIADASS